MKSEEINNVIDELTYIMEDLPTRPSEIMKSEEYNNSCEVIELRLNVLYEKIRILEELHDFIKDYVDKEISDKQSQYKEKLKIISDLSDQYRDSSFVAQLVPFILSTETVKDRDGTALTKMILNDNKIEVPGTSTTKATIESVNVNTKNICYSNTLDNLTKNETGEIVLIDETSETGGACADIIINFADPIDCNYLNLSPVNGTISDVKLITKENAVIEDTSEDSYMPEQTIIGIKATISTKNRKIISDYDNKELFESFSEEPVLYETQSETVRDMMIRNHKKQKQRDIKKKIYLNKDLTE